MFDDAFINQSEVCMSCVHRPGSGAPASGSPDPGSVRWPGWVLPAELDWARSSASRSDSVSSAAFAQPPSKDKTTKMDIFPCQGVCTHYCKGQNSIMKSSYTGPERNVKANVKNKKQKQNSLLWRSSLLPSSDTFPGPRCPVRPQIPPQQTETLDQEFTCRENLGKFMPVPV